MSVPPSQLQPTKAYPPLAPDAATSWTRGGGATENGLQWARYLAAAARYKWLIAGVIGLGAVASLVVARLARPLYEVQSTIWISSETPQGRTTGPIRLGELVNSTAWPDLLRSFAILDKVVEQMALFIAPADSADTPAFAGFALADRFRPGTYELSLDAAGQRWALVDERGTRIEEGVVGDSVGRAAGFRWRPDSTSLGRDRSIRFTVRPPRDASLRLREQLSIALPRESNLLRVTMLGETPARDAATMNALTREFVATAASLKRRNHAEFALTLQQQVGYAEKELREAEIALETFRVNTITLPAEGGPMASGVELTLDPVLGSFFSLKTQQDDLAHQRRVVERTLADVRAGTLDVMALWPIPVVQTSAPELRALLEEHARLSLELQALRRVYMDAHPKVRELEANDRVLRETTIPAHAAALLRDLSLRAEDLEERLRGASSELREIPTRTIEELRLRRNVEVREALYTTLKNRFEEARLAEASALADVSVLDSAVASQEVASNTAPRLAMLGIAGSIGLALGLVLLLDRFDRRFRYPTQVTGELGIPILGAVPRIRSARGTRRQSAEEVSQVVESFRSLRLALRHTLGASPPFLLTVSSPGVGDGKSLVSANLALSFAESGHRTLLIDGDIRRGALHSAFGADRTPGLTDYLAGSAVLAEVLRPTTDVRLQLLPSGSRRRSGPELLTSPAMQRLLAHAASQFDVVVVDSAPLGAGIDPFALGTATGNLLLVLRAGTTDRRMAEAKLQVLDRLPVRLVGAVLNDVEARGVYRYYSYLYGYTPEVEEAASGTLVGSVN